MDWSFDLRARRSPWFFSLEESFLPVGLGAPSHISYEWWRPARLLGRGVPWGTPPQRLSPISPRPWILGAGGARRLLRLPPTGFYRLDALPGLFFSLVESFLPVGLGAPSHDGPDILHLRLQGTDQCLEPRGSHRNSRVSSGRRSIGLVFRPARAQVPVGFLASRKFSAGWFRCSLS